MEELKMQTATNLEKTLQKLIAKKAILVGIGNTMKSDDGIGVLLIEKLLENSLVKNNIKIINVETVIENYVFPIAQSLAKNVILIDAVQGIDKNNGEVGEIIFGKISDFEQRADFSTHKLSLSLSAKIFAENHQETYLLGIIVGNTDFGFAVSREVLHSAKILEDLIINCCEQVYLPNAVNINTKKLINGVNVYG